MKNAAKQLQRLTIPLIGVIALVIGFAVTLYVARPDTARLSPCEAPCIAIRDDGFSQSELAVEVNTEVEFRTMDGKNHNLALGNGSEHKADNTHESTDSSTNGDHRDHDHINGTESGVFGADESWKVRFKKPGTFIVHDHNNPGFSILVVAYEKT